ncbi:MAG: outer membrane beta-barrel protein [Saprospiraceae bacterium]
MKASFCCLLVLITFCTAAQGQTRSHKNNLSAGGGIQEYNGDLGNSFFNFKEEWYGVARLAYSRYLNRSLDAQAFATGGHIGRCFDGVVPPGEHITMLRSAFFSLGLDLKYKFADGRFLPEDARFAPYVYAGAALSKHRDLWNDQGPRVNEGIYTSINGGLGLTYRVCSHFQLNYNLGLGYYTTDALDFITQGANDMYLQHTVSVGVDF